MAKNYDHALSQLGPVLPQHRQSLECKQGELYHAVAELRRLKEMIVTQERAA